MTTHSPVASIARRWWLVVGMAVLGGLLGGIPQPEAVEEQATTFYATHTLLASGAGDASVVTPSQVTLLATAGEVPRRAAEELGFQGNPAELASQLEVLFDFETTALTITATEETGERAELVANAFADQLVAYLAELQDTVHTTRLAASRERLDALRTSLDELTEQLGTDPDNAVLQAEQEATSRQYGLEFEQNRNLEQDQGRLSFTTLQRAQAVPNVEKGLSAPTSRTVRALMGFVVGAVLGAIAAIVVGRLDNKIRTREQAEAIMGMRARVIFPELRQAEGGIVVRPGRQDPLSDSYRTVRNVVGFVQSGLAPTARRTAHVTLVVSPGPGDGKTSLTANLAAAFHETGQRTIAVNTDFRRPRLFEAIMGYPPAESPFELHEIDNLPRRALPVAQGPDGLEVLDLSNVYGSPGELARATMRQIERLESTVDEIVIDTSPVGATAEVLDLVPHADVIVLVARVGHTSIQATERTIGILGDLATAPILLVLGGIKMRSNPYHEYTDRRPNARDDEPDEPDTTSIETDATSLQATE